MAAASPPTPAFWPNANSMMRLARPIWSGLFCQMAGAARTSAICYLGCCLNLFSAASPAMRTSTTPSVWRMIRRCAP